MIGGMMKKIKKIIIPITQKQTCLIREYVAKNGYKKHSGKRFYLIAQPVVRDFNERLDIILLNEAEGDKLQKVFKKMGLVK